MIFCEDVEQPTRGKSAKHTSAGKGKSKQKEASKEKSKIRSEEYKK